MTASLETPSAGCVRALVRTLVSSKQAFCVAVAFLMVALRLVSFDYRFFFTLYSIPNHDMSDDAGFFATNMHAMRLYGNIVWWNPMFGNGYAQYFQLFLSPLARSSP